jgi:hypothetical protein
MVILGRIQNGVVAFGSDISLPEGLEVTVVVPTKSDSTGGLMSESQRRALREARRENESLSNENPGDTFSGADHDRILYGNE